MADATATFGIDIEATGADSAASSLEDLASKIQADTGALREMTNALRTMQRGGMGASESATELKDKINAMRQSVAQSQATFVQMGGTFGKGASQAAGGLEELAGSADGAGMSTDQMMMAAKGAMGPMGGLFERANMLSKGLGNVNVMAVGAALAVVALVVAVVAAAVKLAQFALACADAARSAALNVAAVSKTSASLAGLAGILPGVSAATGVAKEDLVGLAQTLSDAGVKAADMPAALRAVATAEAALGKGAAAKLVEQLKSGKKTAGELAAEMDQKFGGIVAKKLLGIDAQFATLKTSVASLFDGINIEPFLAGLHSVLGLFDQTSVTGQALRTLMSTIFQPLMDAAAAVFPYIAGFIKQATIVALEMAVTFSRIKAAINSAFGGSSTSSILTVANVMKVVRVILTVIGGAFMVVGIVAMIAWKVISAAIGIVVGILQSLWGDVQRIGSAFSAVGSAASSAWDGITAGLSAAWSAVTGFVGRFASAGASIMQAIAGGIGSVAGAIIDAVLAPFRGAIGAVKALLGIASPSRVFRQIGLHTAAGFEGGIDSGSGGVTDAAGGLAEAAFDGAAGAPGQAGKAGAAGRAQGGGRGAVTLTINVNASGGASDIAQAVRQAVVGFFEEQALEAGAVG